MFGWKRSSSKLAPESDPQLLRFFNQSPSFLDDPQNTELFQKRACKVLEPRPVDEGRPSYWEAVSSMQRTRLAAQNGVRRKKLNKFNILSVDRALVRSHGFSIAEEPDNTAYECVADLHRTIDMRPPDTLESFIELLRAQLLEACNLGNSSRNQGAVSYESLNKDDVQKLMKDVLRGCPNSDLGGVHDWVRQAVDEDQSNNSS